MSSIDAYVKPSSSRIPSRSRRPPGSSLALVKDTPRQTSGSPRISPRTSPAVRSREPAFDRLRSPFADDHGDGLGISRRPAQSPTTPPRPHRPETPDLSAFVHIPAQPSAEDDFVPGYTDSNDGYAITTDAADRRVQPARTMPAANERRHSKRASVSHGAAERSTTALLGPLVAAAARERPYASPSIASPVVDPLQVDEGLLSSARARARHRQLQLLVDYIGPQVLDGVDVETILSLDTAPRAISRPVTPPPVHTPAPTPSSSTTILATPLTRQKSSSEKGSVFGRLLRRKSLGAAAKRPAIVHPAQDSADAVQQPRTTLEMALLTHIAMPAPEPMPSAEPGVFGVALADQPEESYTLSIVGGRHCLLPTTVFVTVEALFRSGMSTIGLFRLPGDPSRVKELIRELDAPPFYGEILDLAGEPVHNISALLRRFLRELPEPVFDSRLFSLLRNASIDSTAPLEQNIAAVRVVLRLLPRRRGFSTMIYLCSFLAQIPFQSRTHLDSKSLSIILGPALFAPRLPGISGLGPTASVRTSTLSAPLAALDDDGATAIRQSQLVLQWILDHWTSIASSLLQPMSSPDGLMISEGTSEHRAVVVKPQASPSSSHQAEVVSVRRIPIRKEPPPTETPEASTATSASSAAPFDRRDSESSASSAPEPKSRTVFSGAFGQTGELEDLKARLAEGARRQDRLGEELREVKAQLATLEEENASLREEVKLRADREQAARDRLDSVRTALGLI